MLLIKDLNLGFRTLVDGMEDAVNEAYVTWPTSSYLVGEDGAVAYAGGHGSFGFKLSEFRTAIESYLKMRGNAQ